MRQQQTTLDNARPRPPKDLLTNPLSDFRPAPELREWVMREIVEDDGSIHNPDHEHLAHATIGFLWTNTACKMKGKGVAGMAEIPSFMCNQWQRQRQEYQIEQWFGGMPDFIITLNAPYCDACSDAEFCALVEHELYHCAQAEDEYGAPKFVKATGLPSFTMRGHDVEEFVGVVRRYGTGHPDSPLAQLVQAAAMTPEVSKISVAKACGTCLAKAA